MTILHSLSLILAATAEAENPAKQPSEWLHSGTRQSGNLIQESLQVNTNTISFCMPCSFKTFAILQTRSYNSL
jgi:hypothetical protein